MGMKRIYSGRGQSCCGDDAAVYQAIAEWVKQCKTVFISSMIAFIFMAVLNLACGNLKRFLQYRPKDYVKMIALGFMGKFLYSVLYFYGLSGLAAGDACIINYLWPVMTVVFSCLWLGERVYLAQEHGDFRFIFRRGSGGVEGRMEGLCRGICGEL